MRNAYVFHRLRKYRRRKLRARTPEKFNKIARLYWRYHHVLYGTPGKLWE